MAQRHPVAGIPAPMPRPGALRRGLESAAYHVLSLHRQDLLFRVLPGRLEALRNRYPFSSGALDEFRFSDRPIPPELLSTPGIKRDPDQELQAASENPLRVLFDLWPESREHIHRGMWRNFLRVGPGMARLTRVIERRNQEIPRAPARVDSDPDELTAQVKAEAARLGIPLVGVAPYDETYMFVGHNEAPVGERVVVCFVEQNWEATQTAPSLNATKAAFTSSAEATRLTGELAKFIRSVGYRARVNTEYGHGVIIHYAVQAGLGQLGLNGQLLSPEFGSRCHPGSISTDAPLRFDRPVDYGIPRICDECRICVRRCPSGAIPARRRMHRGVEKAKIDPRRCVPMVAIAHGCAVCTKVCPIQRYGLSAVIDEWERSGTVLGKGSDDLEGYWFDGQYQDVSTRPKLDPVWLELRPRAFAVPPVDRRRL